MADDTDALLDATTALYPPLLTALEVLADTGRHLDPPDLPDLVERLAAFRGPLEAGLTAFGAAAWPDHLAAFRAHSETAAGHLLRAFDGFAECLAQGNPVIGAYRALGGLSLATEALYPVAFMLPPVNRFFLTGAARQDEALQQRLLAVDPGADDVGVMHAANGPAERGGFSLYVPEYLTPDQPAPLVVALHGGSGHGRRFLWTWLRDARSRGAILVAATARSDTWSLMGPDVDTGNVLTMVDYVRSRWTLDESRLLLTGMSDGGTFSYVSGLRDDSPFTHLAPISATFHPLLLGGATPQRLQRLPVFLVHGVRDWMFPVDVARMARDTLRDAGAHVTYVELDDLSHTYPSEQNQEILDWLLA